MRVLITGCSSGIGHLTALELARRGHIVIATSRRADLKPLLDAAAAEGLVIDVATIDVADAASVEAAVTAAIGRHGGIDAVVNNAGIQIRGAVEDTDDDEALAMFDTNVLGPLRVLRAVLPVMRNSRSGVIVNISSLAGLASLPGEGFYAASKHALEAVSEALHYELAPHGLRTVLIEPGGFPTGLGRGGWTRRSGTGSAYRDDMDAFEASVEQFQAQGGPTDPQQVADAIADALDDTTSPFRVTVGEDATVVSDLHRQLPFHEFADLLQLTLAWNPRGR